MIAQLTLSSEVAIGIASAIVLSVVGALGVIFKLLMASYEARIKAIEIERDNWKQLGTEAVQVTRKATNRVLTLEGKPVSVEVAAVVGEHQSPMSEAQENTAALQTARASLVADALILGLEPRAASLANKAKDVAEKAAEVAEEILEEAKDKTEEAKDGGT